MQDNVHRRHTQVPKETPLEKGIIRRANMEGGKDGLEETTLMCHLQTGYTLRNTSLGQAVRVLTSTHSKPRYWAS